LAIKCKVPEIIEQARDSIELETNWRGSHISINVGENTEQLKTETISKAVSEE